MAQSKIDDDILNEFIIDLKQDMWEITIAIKDNKTGLEWWAKWMPQAWKVYNKTAQEMYDFFSGELSKQPANWTQTPPFKENKPLNITIGSKNGQNYELAIPYKGKKKVT